MAPSLDSMPFNIQHVIFSYLAKPLAGYALDGTPCTFNILGQLKMITPKASELLQTHPFQNLAATCKKLRSATETSCRHLLNTHKVILGDKKVPELDGGNWEQLVARDALKRQAKAKRQTKAKPQTKEKRQTRAKTYRNLWIRCTHERCIFCGRKSKRRAMFDMLVYCCQRCDESMYGAKVSQSRVRKEDKLKPLVWLRPDLVFKNAALKPLRVAKHESGTYLLKEEVKVIKAYCNEEDPDKSMLKEAVKRYGAGAEKLVDENAWKEILLQDMARDTLKEVFSDMLL